MEAARRSGPQTLNKVGSNLKQIMAGEPASFWETVVNDRRLRSSQEMTEAVGVAMKLSRSGQCNGSSVTSSRKASVNQPPQLHVIDDPECAIERGTDAFSTPILTK